MKVVPLLVLPLCAFSCQSTPDAPALRSPSGAVEPPGASAGGVRDSALDERQTYVALRAGTSMVVDGKLDESSWLGAPETGLFVDIQGSALPAPRHKTRAKMLWDDDYFYIGAIMEAVSYTHLTLPTIYSV